MSDTNTTNEPIDEPNDEANKKIKGLLNDKKNPAGSDFNSLMNKIIEDMDDEYSKDIDRIQEALVARYKDDPLFKAKVDDIVAKGEKFKQNVSDWWNGKTPPMTPGPKTDNRTLASQNVINNVPTSAPRSPETPTGRGQTQDNTLSTAPKTRG